MTVLAGSNIEVPQFIWDFSLKPTDRQVKMTTEMEKGEQLQTTVRCRNSIFRRVDVLLVLILLLVSGKTTGFA
ncbi:hypothetical protein L2E82_39051 [Cichorium intybus]|uniref:Uncharacterized protein n=1 Tax=Cichorium intybus TaxID=13427 RepID=A0ACB9AHS3_CICIN|nr:hypothetical protein L2E82_39051 [Cichorium intybus]